jgi:hypothetical protein
MPRYPTYVPEPTEPDPAMVRVFPREAFASKDSLRAFLRGNPNGTSTIRPLAVALSGALYAAQPVSKHKKGKRCHSEAHMNAAVETSGTPTYKNTAPRRMYQRIGTKGAGYDIETYSPFGRT